MFKTAATRIAHNSTIPALGGNRDLRPLQDLITAEKAVLMSYQKLSLDLAKASEALKTWGMGEGEDLADTLSASTTILVHFSSALSQCASYEQEIRDKMKALRTKEEDLDELKRRRKSVVAKADSADKKLSKMSPEHKNRPGQADLLNQLQQEIRSMDAEIVLEEARLGDLKRMTSRDWMGLKFGGLLECSQKGLVAGNYGKVIAAEIPEDVTEPGLPRAVYHGNTRTASLVDDALRAMNGVSFSSVLSNAPQPVSELVEPAPPPDEKVDSWPATNIGPPSYLSTPQGLGTGHFLDSAEGSSQVPPPIDSGSYFSEKGGYSTEQAPQLQSNAPAMRSVDDFGIQTTSSLTSSGSIGGRGGGRFATFPVKNNRPRADSSGGNGFASSLLPHTNEPSFSSSIADSLGPGAQIGAALVRPDNLDLSTSTFDNPEPKLEMMHTPTHASPPGPPPGAAPPNYPPNNWTDASGSVEDDSGSQLPYAFPGAPGGRYSAVKTVPESEAPTPKKRHVRFGEVSDVEEEMERREMERMRINETGKEEGDVEQEALIQSPVDSEPATPRPTDKASYRVPPPPFEEPPAVPAAPTPPPFDSQAEERALNAAAAREVSRELDSLSFSPPTLKNLDFEPVNLEHPTSPVAPLSPRVPVPSSPLAPPNAPFSRRSVSPGPRVDTDSLSYAPPESASPRTLSQLDQMPSPYSPTKSSPPQIHVQPLASTPPYGPGQRDGSPSSPRTPISPILPPPTPLNFGLRSSSASPSSSPSPYRTPPEYPRSSSLNTSPAANRSSSSLVPSPGSGARTISAAAFKRPPPRISSAADLSGGGSDTSPLSLKKRTLPSSPYPQRPPGSASGLARTSASNLRAQNLAEVSGRDRAVSNPQSFQPQGQPMTREPDPPQTQGAPPPQQRQLNQPPPNNENDKEGADMDDQFDYISAYVNSPESGATFDSPRLSGYGQGRFATNLEHDSGLR